MVRKQARRRFAILSLCTAIAFICGNIFFRLPPNLFSDQDAGLAFSPDDQKPRTGLPVLAVPSTGAELSPLSEAPGIVLQAPVFAAKLFCARPPCRSPPAVSL